VAERAKENVPAELRELLSQALEVQAQKTKHPKLLRLKELLIEHFERKAAGGQAASTRVIVFSELRSSVQTIVAELDTAHPLIKVAAFVGQGSSKTGGRGQSQKEQKRVVAELRSGVFNVLVATCIAEEGLDIGEVDLIVHYDVVVSSTRKVQRNGRTGRRKPGRIVQLYVAGEEKKMTRAKAACKAIKKAMERLGSKTSKGKLKMVDNNPPVLPENARPVMKMVDITAPPFDPSQVGAARIPTLRNRLPPDRARRLVQVAGLGGDGGSSKAGSHTLEEELDGGDSGEDGDASDSEDDELPLRSGRQKVKARRLPLVSDSTPPTDLCLAGDRRAKG
jgi:superfamily II DNA/RNA helicase